MSDLNLKQLGAFGSQFLQTPYGEYVVEKLSELYNGEHHKAEEATTIEQKALAVERAAGIRVAIDLLTHDAAMYDAGQLTEKKEPPAVEE